MKKIYTLLCGIFIAINLLSQTTLISPSGDGGFASGATFAANGWTVANGTNAPWVIGTAVSTSPFSGNSAYISNDGGTTNSYVTTNPSNHYFYRDITVPAGETKIVLTFNWAQQGEASWDIWQVFTAPTSVVPTGSNTHPGSGTTNVPASITGATYVGNGAVATGVQTATFFLPSSLAGTTFRLIFSWKSDVSAGTQPPAAIDNISLVSSAPSKFISTATGNWSAGATWVGGVVPTLLDSAEIAAGHTVTIDATGQSISQLTIKNTGTLTYGTTPTSFAVNGNLDINTGGTFNVFNGTTGKTLTVAGNIIHDGTLNISVGTTTAGNLTLNGSAPQTVSGSGTYTNNHIRNLTLANTSTATPNVIWNKITYVGYALTLTGARVEVGSGNKICWGSSTVTATTLTVSGVSGFLPGSKFSRFWTTAQTGSAITAGTTPTTTTSRYPFIMSDGTNRSLWISRSSSSTTGNTAGELEAVYNHATTNTTVAVTDGAYTINNRYDGNWVVSTASGYVYTSGTHLLTINGGNTFYGSTTNMRVMNAAAAVGTHGIANAATPTGFRSALTTAQLIGGAWYLGINNADLQYQSIATGDWNVGSTWNKGSVPGCNDTVNIMPGHTVTINSAGNNARIVRTLLGATLTMASGDLTVECTNRNGEFNIDGGTYNMNGGTLNVNGKFAVSGNSNSRFNQSAGNIVVDGNSGVLATSISGHVVDMYCHTSTGLNLTGGTFTVVDPSKAAATGNYAFKVYPSPTGISCGSGTGWTLNLGNGSTTANAGGHANGFQVALNNSTTAFKLNGPTNINLRRDSANTFVYVDGNTVFRGDLTITKGDFRNIGISYYGGNITNNDTLTNTSTIYLGDYNINAVAPLAAGQTIGGTGVFRNNATPASVTANLASLTVNNSSGGVTLNVPLSVSSTLTMTSGIVNTTATNFLQLGTATAAGTLTGTAFSNTTHINGPFKRTFANGSTGTASLSNTHLMPVGMGGTYLPFWVSPTTTAAVTMTTEAFTTNSGSMGAGVTTLNGSRWESLPSNPTAITSAFVRGGDASLTSSNVILQSNSSAGTYDGVSGGSSFTSGSPNYVSSSLALSPYLGYYGSGDMTLCTTPLAQPTALSFRYITNIAATGVFTAASPAPTGYLVVRYPSGGVVTSPTNYTNYSAGAALGVGTVVGNYYTAPFSFNLTGLTASTTYDFYIYSFNNSACAGPDYLTVTPLTGSLTTCAAAFSTTGMVLSYNLQTTTGFTLNWTAPTTPPTAGAEYILDIATNSAMTNFVTGFENLNVGGVTTYGVTGLNSGATYWARIRVKEVGTSCTSPALTTNWHSIATLPAGSVATITENFDATTPTTTATTYPAGWYEVTSDGNAYYTTTGRFSVPNSMMISNSATPALRATLAIPLVSNAAVATPTHRARFRLQVSSGASKLYFGYLTVANDPTSFIVVDSFVPTTTNTEYVVKSFSTSAATDVLAFKPDGTATVTFYLDDFNWEPIPSCTIAEAGTASASPASICVSGSAILSATGYNKDSSNLQYVWEYDTTAAFATPTNLAAPTNFYVNGNTGTITDTMYYRLKVTCTSSGTVIDTSNIVQVNVVSPTIVSTVNDTLCGFGSATLIARTNSPYVVQWYTKSGNFLSNGDTLFSPTIAQTDTFYARAASTPSSTTSLISSATPTGLWTATNGSAGVMFNLIPNNEIRLDTILARTSSTTNPQTVQIYYKLGTYAGFTTNSAAWTLVATVSAPLITNATNGNYLQIVLPSGLVLNTGNTYGMFVNYTSSYQNATIVGTPNVYSNADLTFVSGATSSGPFTGSIADRVFTGKFIYSSGCLSSSFPVIANVTTPPSITANATSPSVCQGNKDTVNVTSGHPHYTFNWSDGLGAGSSKEVTPSSTKNYFVTATDTTTTGATVGCQEIDTVSITVNDTVVYNAITQDKPTFCQDVINKLVVPRPVLQPSTYAFSASAGTYTSLGSPTNIPGATGGDDIVQDSVPIGFTFNYNGTNFTMCAVSSNGWVQPNNGTQTLNILTNALATQSNMIAPYWDDNSTATLASPAITPSVDYETSGTAPNRIFTVAWSNIRIGNGGGGTNSINMQAKLHENGNIEFVYDTVSVGLFATTSASIGISGTTNYKSVTLLYPNTTSTVSSTTENTTNSRIPTSGTTMLFTRPSTPTTTWSPTTGLYTDAAATSAYSSGASADTIYAKNTASVNYTIAVANANCSVNAQFKDSVRTASTSVVLASSSVSGGVAQCTEGGWTYYGTAGDPSKWFFAIEKGTSPLSGESVAVHVSDTVHKKMSSSGTNQEHASYLMRRGWDVTATTQPGVTNPVKIRFFYSPADSASVDSLRNLDSATVKTANASSLLVKTPFSWFKTNGTQYNDAWRASIVGNRFPASHITLTPAAYGTINGVNYAEFTGITSFSGGTGGAGFGAPGAGGGVGLPVTWAGFDVKTAEVGNELTWKTASEKNTDYFEVQYSYDASQWSVASDKLPAAGNSADLRTYHYTHSDFAPFVYYRIKQVDLDGKFDYSVIKLAKRAAGPSFVVNVFPVPLENDNIVNVSVKGVDKSPMTIKLTDVTGKVIRFNTITPANDMVKESFDMSPLTPGIYFIEVQNGQGKETIKVSR